MNAHAHAVLELSAALEVVAGHAGSDLGKDAVRALRPFDVIPAIESRYSVQADREHRGRFAASDACCPARSFHSFKSRVRKISRCSSCPRRL